MADLQLINPLIGEGQGRCNLTHFAWRFPSHIMTNNFRVDQSYTQLSYQLLRRKDFRLDELKRRPILRASIDLDEYIVQKEISLDAIDNTISKFKMSLSQSENPKDYVPFFVLASPIFSYLIDEKKHELDTLID